jgi:hypothetical protein
MSNKSIRDRLLELEKRTPGLVERFEKEKKKMLERKLTRRERIVWVLTMLLGAYFAVYLSYQAIAMQEIPQLARIGIIGGAVFGAAWVILAIRVLRKGHFTLFRDENAVHRLTFGFSLLLLIVMLLLGNQAVGTATGIQMVLMGGIFFLIFGIPAIFNMRINRTESALSERLLKIELQLAELADKAEQKK